MASRLTPADAFAVLLRQSATLTRGATSYALPRVLAVQLDSPDLAGADVGRQYGEHWELTFPAHCLPPDVSPRATDAITLDTGEELTVLQSTRFGDMWRCRCVGAGVVRR